MEGCTRPLVKEAETLVENAGTEPSTLHSAGLKPPDDGTWHTIHSPHR